MHPGCTFAFHGRRLVFCRSASICCFHVHFLIGGLRLSTDYNFSTRVSRVGAGTLKDAFTPEAVRQAGLVTYWGAEFEFPTCPAFSRGVMKCADRGMYAFTLQTDAYNERVVWWMRHVRAFECDPDWIVPTHGTIFALATAIRLFLLPGHKQLLVLEPGYNRYAQAASRMGLETIGSQMHPDAEGVYRIDWQDLEQKMADPGNGLLVFSNPNNPTGRVLTKDELENIAILSEKHGLPVFCDEIFAEITRVGPVFPYIHVSHGRDYAMTCTSLGKCMSLTGINHANLLIPSVRLREAYIHQKYADHYGSIDPVLYAGLMEAYTEDGASFIRALNAQMDANTARFEERLPQCVPGVRVFHPEGTFVIWADYTGLGLDDDTLSRKLSEEVLFLGDDGSDYDVSRQFYRYNLAVPPKCLENSFDYFAAHWRA